MRKTHCTHRAMRFWLLGRRERETAAPFPTVKCGRLGAECALRQGRSPAGSEGVVPVDEGIRDCGE